MQWKPFPWPASFREEYEKFYEIMKNKPINMKLSLDNEGFFRLIIKLTLKHTKWRTIGHKYWFYFRFKIDISILDTVQTNIPKDWDTYWEYYMEMNI